jgi:hypothetical protein
MKRAALEFCLVLSTACDSPGAPTCNADADGVTGMNAGSVAVDLTVSDTAFAVGAPDSGSTEANITVQNLATVILTMTNVGSKPHDFVVQCLPTPNANGCPAESCFPGSANFPALEPGASATATFTTPAHEGGYRFISDQPGDTQTTADGGVTGLVGQFNVM